MSNTRSQSSYHDDIESFKEAFRKNLKRVVFANYDHFFVELSIKGKRFFVAGEHAFEMGKDGKKDVYACVYLSDSIDSLGCCDGEEFADAYIDENATDKEIDGYAEYLYKAATEEATKGEEAEEDLNESSSSTEHMKTEVKQIVPNRTALGVFIPPWLGEFEKKDSWHSYFYFMIGKSRYAVVSDVDKERDIANDIRGTELSRDSRKAVEDFFRDLLDEECIDEILQFCHKKPGEMTWDELIKKISYLRDPVWVVYA